LKSGDRILCVDPGVRAVGAAIFSFEFNKGSTLVDCDYVKNPIERGMAPRDLMLIGKALQDRFGTFHHLVLERMRIYPGPQRFDPNDLVGVTGTVYSISGFMAHILAPEQVNAFFPSEWKGNMKKEDMLQHIENQLNDSEKLLIPDLPKSTRHNVIDAIGIGLKFTGRL